jgi:hypothetical protein
VLSFRKFASLVVSVSVLAISCAAADTPQKKPPKKTRAKKSSEAAPLPPYNAHTLSPLPLDQMPAVPPKVSYTGGQLTIVAHNSTLADILRAVHKETGADLDVPPNATERVVADLGPGPARDVLADLLNGTHFNYVVLGSASDATAVQRVVLTAKTGPETTSTAAANTPPSPQQAFPGNRFQQPQNMPPQQVEPEPEQAEDNTDTPDDNSGDAAAEEQQQPDANNPGNPQAPKTPEQLLQELQRQQQQMQQQQGQPGAPQIVYPNAPINQPPNQNPEQ